MQLRRIFNGQVLARLRKVKGFWPVLLPLTQKVAMARSPIETMVAVQNTMQFIGLILGHRRSTDKNSFPIKAAPSYCCLLEKISSLIWISLSTISIILVETHIATWNSMKQTIFQEWAVRAISWNHWVIPEVSRQPYSPRCNQRLRYSQILDYRTQFLSRNYIWNSQYVQFRLIFPWASGSNRPINRFWIRLASSVSPSVLWRTLPASIFDK